MRFAKCVSAFRPSPIRGMMNAVINPNVISFAGGMPGNELFPVEDVREIIEKMPRKEMDTALQYGPTDGLPRLLKDMNEWMTKKGFDMSKNRIIITTGSTQAMSIVTKLFVDPHDVVLTEDPVFVGSAGAFCAYQADIIGVKMDREGIVIDDLEKKLARNPKFIYMTPTFHNPAGLTYSRERREQFLEIMAKHPDVIILEDDAYGELYYDEDVKSEIIPMKTYAKNENQIIYTSSFSKIFGPGLRIGWMIVPNEIYEAAEICKQSMDACTPQFSQMLAAEFIESGRMERYIEMLRKVYKERRDAMVNCLHKYCPEVEFVTPQGGFFLWAKMPEGVDEKELFTVCAEKGVVFVTGDAFNPEYKKNRYVRLSFSNTPPEVIERGVKILAEGIASLRK